MHKLITGLAAILAVLVMTTATAGTAGAAPVSNRVSVAASLSGIGNPATTRLTIKRNGKVVYDKLVRSSICHATCVTARIAPGRSPLKVLDLRGDGQENVVLGLYSGGAHCCFVDQVFTYSAGKHTFVRSEKDFFDPGAAIEKLAGHYEFVSADDAFAYAFTDFADSGLPIQIWSFTGSRFANVTRQFPALIKADAASFMKGFDHDLKNGVGLIAAWAADEDLLGNESLVSSTLAALNAKHELNSSFGKADSGTKFIAALQKLLRKLGYTSG